MKNAHDYYCNRECQYFPCHTKSDAGDYFNCMFCFCPLYLMGERCGGNYRILENGVKDCSACLIPHSQGGYEYISRKLNEEVFARTANKKEE